MFGIKNPIKLARRVMEDGRHLMLAGQGALSFARQIGFPECAPESLIVDSERRRWESKHGTVGCVAFAIAPGCLAVATSTGGIFYKLPGRVGDSPLIGCGTYADDAGAMLCTGYGEAIIRVLMAKTAVDFLKAGTEPTSAASQALDLLAVKTGSTAGLILIDRNGNVGYARNAVRMPICVMSHAGTIVLES